MPTGPCCRAAPAPHCRRAPPWVWGLFRCPTAPHQPHHHGAVLEAPGPLWPILPGPHGALAQGTALAGARVAAPSTPSPRPAMEPEPPVGLGVSHGSGPPAGRRLSLQRWRQGQGCVQRLPPRHTASCPHPFPAGHQHWPGPLTPDGQHRRSPPALSPSVPKHPGTEGQHPALVRSPGHEPEVLARTGSRRRGLLK